MRAHNNLVAEDINMALHQRHRLSQDVEASAHQIDKQHFVVAHNAEDTLVVVAGTLGAEVDNDALG